MDKKGNMALGYSVVNGVDCVSWHSLHGQARWRSVRPDDSGEGTIINGAGVQTTTNSRWGDYTDMTVDPTDDCTFWYVNEYYHTLGQASASRLADANR